MNYVFVLQLFVSFPKNSKLYCCYVCVCASK